MYLRAILPVILAAAVITLPALAREATYTAVFDGAKEWDDVLYDRNIDVDSAPGSARLLKTELFADEMGNVTDATLERTTQNTRARKDIVIEDPAADSAVLVVYTQAGAAKVILEVNGVKNEVQFDAKRMLGGGWSRIDVDPKQLRKGLNTFVLYPAGDGALNLWIDNSRFPNRSARSVDGGATWDYDHLGVQGFCDGEYLMRLRLVHYPKSGEILSDFLSVGDLVTNDPVKPLLSLKSIQLKAEGDFPQDTGITLYLRGGATPAYDPSNWDPWKPAEAYRTPGTVGRDWKYFQWKAALSTKTGLRTPALFRITATAVIDVPNASGKSLSADVSKNRKITRGYYNYAYQQFGHERLDYLREYFRLDEVVGMCSSEFEKFEVLATWVRSQWRDGWLGVRTKGLKTPWDAWIALNMNGDFKASGMCTIYANTFVQCALAVGLNARGVVLDHHFVSEVWSNEFEKWICIDIGFNNQSIRTFHMEHNGIPLSAVEVLQAVNDGKQAELDLVPPKIWRKTWKGDQAKEAAFMDPIQWKARVGIPTRNNFLESWLPGELQHGFNAYSYDGYLWWKKSSIPEYEEYTLHTSHYRDLYWSLNQVELHLSRAETPGELRVQFDTVTPNLDKIMVRVDGGEWQPVGGDWVWPLRKGQNRIEARPMNKWGHEGITSEVTVTY